MVRPGEGFLEAETRVRGRRTQGVPKGERARGWKPHVARSRWSRHLSVWGGKKAFTKSPQGWGPGGGGKLVGIMKNAGLEEAQAGIKIAGRDINNLRYADDTTLMAESEEELKSLLMKVQVDRDRFALQGRTGDFP